LGATDNRIGFKICVYCIKMWNCYLCDSEEWTAIGLCTTCSNISKIVACYSAEEVLETLERVYLREKDKVDNKVDVEKKGMTTRSKKKPKPERNDSEGQNKTEEQN